MSAYRDPGAVHRCSAGCVGAPMTETERQDLRDRRSETTARIFMALTALVLLAVVAAIFASVAIGDRFDANVRIARAAACGEKGRR